MSVIGSNILAGASGQAGYFLTNSLRFRSSASAYLNRTFGTPTDNKKFTWSAWVKRGSVTAAGGLFDAYLNGVNFSSFYFQSNGTIQFYNIIGGADSGFLTTPVYRDPSAWYHIVFVYDSANATAADRGIIYVNSVRQTVTNPYDQIGLNEATYLNNVYPNYIGRQTDSGLYFDGYIAELNFVDGQALTPSSFGETSTSTGVWIPKKYTGTYGTNGFYLPFTNTASTSTLGNDFSGNSNTWTVNNISLTAGTTYDSMTDVPTLTSLTAANYGVYNPLNKFSATTISNGNLLVTNGNSGDGWSTTGSTFAFPQTGKWYAEFTIVNRPFSGTTGIGIVPSNISFVNQSGDSARFAWGRVYFDNSGIIGPSNASVQNTSQAPTYTTGDIISVAFDSDNGTVWWAKNGTWTNSGNPATGTNPAYSGLTATAFPMGFVITSEGYSSSQIAGNWGQRPFAYTPPSGFVRLNTFNLPTPTIGATASTTANKYFDSVIWTGDQTNKQIPLNFTADFVWAKRRSGGDSHRLYDVIRGINKDLQSNATDAEQTNDFGLDFDNGNYLAIDGTKYFGGGGGSGTTFVAWNWEANGTGVTNTNGSITSTVSANTTAGFSIVTYTGNGTGGATVGHGLGVAPSMMIFKTRNDTGGWLVWHTGYNSNQAQMLLNSTDGIYNPGNGLYFNSTYPSSTVATLGTSGATNGSGTTYVAYMFAQVAGYSAFGSYTGNGSSDGPFIYTGFRPAFIMIRSTGSPRRWLMFDDSRFPNNGPNMPTLQANLSDAESTNTENYGDFLSNGFKCRATNGNFNGSGETYIYMMFAENPFKYANAR